MHESSAHNDGSCNHTGGPRVGAEGAGVGGIFDLTALLTGAALGGLVVFGGAGISILRWLAKNSSSQLKNTSLSS